MLRDSNASLKHTYLQVVEAVLAKSRHFLVIEGRGYRLVAVAVDEIPAKAQKHKKEVQKRQRRTHQPAVRPRACACAVMAVRLGKNDGSTTGAPAGNVWNLEKVGVRIVKPSKRGKTHMYGLVAVTSVLHSCQNWWKK